MKSRGGKIRLALVAASFAMMGWMLSGGGIKAQGGGELSPQEKRGKQIYLKGESDGGEIKAMLGGGLELSASAFPCANCHGLRGEGSTEGGLQPPQITWDALTSPHLSAPR